MYSPASIIFYLSHAALMLVCLYAANSTTRRHGTLRRVSLALLMFSLALNVSIARHIDLPGAFHAASIVVTSLLALLMFRKTKNGEF